MNNPVTRLVRTFTFALACLSSTASAQDTQGTLKLAIGQRGLWDTSISELGQRAGIFKKHGLLDIGVPAIRELRDR